MRLVWGLNAKKTGRGAKNEQTSLGLDCWMYVGARHRNPCDVRGSRRYRRGWPQAVPGAKVIAHSSDGLNTQAATTDSNGQYRIAGLDPGQYYITLDALGTGGQGQTVASYLGNSGLTVNWSVAPGATPLASAQPGIQPTSASAVRASDAVLTAKSDPPPGCKGMPGPPCGPKKSKKRCEDDDNGSCHGHGDDD